LAAVRAVGYEEENRIFKQLGITFSLLFLPQIGERARHRCVEKLGVPRSVAATLVIVIIHDAEDCRSADYMLNLAQKEQDNQDQHNQS
jgi:hypothetical protein